MFLLSLQEPGYLILLLSSALFSDNSLFFSVSSACVCVPRAYLFCWTLCFNRALCCAVSELCSLMLCCGPSAGKNNSMGGQENASCVLWRAQRAALAVIVKSNFRRFSAGQEVREAEVGKPYQSSECWSLRTAPTTNTSWSFTFPKDLERVFLLNVKI